MGPLEIVGFAVCWVFAAVVLTWGVMTERRRGPIALRRRRRGGDAPVPAVAEVPLPVPPVEPPAAAGWVVVESIPGTGSEIRAQGQLVVAAALAARGVDVTDLSPRDQRTEVVRTAAGGEVTRFLLRTEFLSPSKPQ